MVPNLIKHHYLETLNLQKEVQNENGVTKEKNDGALQTGSSDGDEAAKLNLTPGSKTITPAPTGGMNTVWKGMLSNMSAAVREELLIKL